MLQASPPWEGGGGGGEGEGGYEGMFSGKLWKNAVAKTCIP